MNEGVPSAPDSITVHDVEMVYVPAGSFLMGSDGYRDESPPHEVFVGGFYIARYPVTNAQYVEFVVASGHGQPTYLARGTYPEGKGDHPAVQVSWHDAQAYCRWLGEKMGHEVRSPTEAEWEKAARGTDGRVYPWGDDFDASKCNLVGSGMRGGTTPVGKYSPQGDSPCGVGDMAGNVWEWTSSLEKPYPYNADDGREDPTAKGKRVVRGGPYAVSREMVRCSARGRADPDLLGPIQLRLYVHYVPEYFGFRVAVSVVSPEES